MIVFEEKEFEEAVFEKDCPLAVPVQITVDADGGLRLLVYSFCGEIAREFEARFSADPLGEEAVRWMAEALGEQMLPLGYDECDIESYPLYDYRPVGLNTDAVLPECEIIDTLEGEAWDDLPLDEFALEKNNPADRMAVVRGEDGKIVCFAGLNDISEEDGCLELTVECSAPYRRRGYGASCTAKLAAFLESLGERSQYVASHLNVPSVRCAEKAGLVRKNSIFPFVFRKSGEDDGEFFDFT